MQDNNLIKQPVTPHRMLATGVGVRDSMQLSDGSRVILGPLSSVTLAAGYGETSREVEVKGEAWFDVVHDNAKPFTVRAGRATIVDIGTRFAVRSDTPEGVSVSVTQGSVSMRAVNTPAQSGVILQAGDNGLLKSGGEVVARRGVVNDDDVAWLSGRLVFREAALDEVKASMRRWYGLEVEFADPSLAGRHITASFNGESPERVLDVLRLVLGADIERHGDTVVVRAAKGSVR
jgi:transmembrane sensor